MKKSRYISFLFLFTLIIFSQNIEQIESFSSSSERTLLHADQYIQLSQELNSKVLSGKLLEKISAKKYLLSKGALTAKESSSRVVLYFESKPSETQKESLSSEGLNCFWELWTPPSSNHPYGFIIADMPVEKFENTIAFDFIKKMDTAEYESIPHNNNGSQSIRATEVWNLGFDGTGVKIGVLDSGLDSFYKGSDLPSSYSAMDYWDYPNLDQDVENITSGHGTHVVGSVLGRGVLSTGHSHINNGTGAFTGIAPGADLVFLKIGGDESSSASNSAEIAAIDAAVNIYNVDILSMSYGGWNTHHDGSAALEQKADWAYDQGVPFFISAGNSAAQARHYSGTVSANSSTSFIQVNFADPGDKDVTLWFNLVWYDGLGTSNNLSLEYYDDTYTELTDVVQNQVSTESIRGTESLYSNYNFYIRQAGTYYLKVVNNSSNSQFFHIYDDWGSYVTFENPDQDYTIGSPATADNAFAVGAYVSREKWTDVNGDTWYYSGNTLNGIANFSSRGPRVDGFQKPNVTAPGHVVLSLRDTDVYTSISTSWIDNDGVAGGDANYYKMQGTSMACPIAAGAAALLLEKNPSITPAQVYLAITNNTNTTGLSALPNSIWGSGRLDIFEAVNSVGGGGGPEEKVVIDEKFKIQMFPPQDWTRLQQQTVNTWNAGNVEDNNFNTIDPTSTYSAICQWMAADQDEWLITPSFALASGTATLEFYAGYSTQWLSSATLKVHISTNGGTNWTQIWQAVDDGQPWGWRYQNVDITNYANNTNIKVAWQYVGNDGDIAAIDNVKLTGFVTVTDIKDDDNEKLPTEYALSQNYPNPFNPSTKINYSIPQSGNVSLIIYDMLGQEVKTLVNEFQNAGSYSIDFNAERLSSGIYFYQIIADDFVDTKKMILIK